MIEPNKGDRSATFEIVIKDSMTGETIRSLRWFSTAGEVSRAERNGQPIEAAFIDWCRHTFPIGTVDMYILEEICHECV